MVADSALWEIAEPKGGLRTAAANKTYDGHTIATKPSQRNNNFCSGRASGAS
jgi:hypothetical protein